jgi:hypothetical protein
MKTFKEFNQLDEGILDTVKDVVKSIGRGIGKGVVGAAKYGAQALGAIPGGLIGGFKSGVGGGGGYGGYGMTRRGGGSSRKIEQLKAELAKARVGSKPSGKPKAPKGTDTKLPPSGLGPKSPTPPTGAPTKVPSPTGSAPSPTGSAPVPPATPTPAVPAPAAPVPAPVKTLTKAEKKDRRDAARTVGGVTNRLGKDELHWYRSKDGILSGSRRAARTDPAKEKLAAKGVELETKRAALQTTKGKLRKGVGQKDVKSFNIGQEMTKGNIIKSGSIASNPEVAKRAAAARARMAARRAGKSAPGSARSVVGAYESADLLNSVMKFLNK